MPSVSSNPPAVLALLLAVGVAVLAATAVSALRMPASRHRTAWSLWAVALAFHVAAMVVAAFGDTPGEHGATGVVNALLAVYAILAGLGIVARLPAGAVAVRDLILDEAPLAIAVVAVASVTYGGLVADSPAHVASHILAPAAFTLLAAICLEGLGYVGRRTATPTARLVSYGFLLTAVAGVSPAFVTDSSLLTYPRALAWVIGLGAVGVGAALRARAPAGSPHYARRPDPISGWSWGGMLGVVVLVVLVLLHRGPEDEFRLVAAVIAFACFAARSTIARRDGTRLMSELRAAEGRFRTLVEQIPLAIYTDALDASSTAQYVSPAIEELLGYTRDEVEGNPEWFPRVLHPDDRWVLDAVGDWQASGAAWDQEFRVVAKDGSVHWVRDQAVIVHDEHAVPLHAQGYMQDVTARKRAEADLRESERRYRDTLENVNLLALSLDSDGIVTFCNDHVCEVTGWPRKELLGRDWYETVGPVERQAKFLQEMREDDLEDGDEERLRTRSGEDRVILWWTTVSRDASGAIVGANSIGQDITERRHAEERLAFLRQNDELTGLPNRTFFTDRLDEAIGNAQDRGHAVGVLFVNLENFRFVNDAYGHTVGDAVLCQFADRLRDAAHGTTLIARHGGDEFIVLLADVEGDAVTSTHAHPADVAQMASAIAGRIGHVLRRPFVHGGHELYLSARTGTGVFPTQAEGGVDDLLKTAHMDAYRPSTATPYGHRAADDSLAPRDELELIARMHHAIERREFVLHYQPVVDLASGAMTAVEALIRWQPPDGELVPPNSFIPLAERTGLIAPITEWVIEEVCAQTARWRRRGIQVDIGFNFPVGLWDRATLLNMLAVIRSHGLTPEDVVIEVTESAVVSDAERSSGAIDVVREHGMRLAIDDFGRGYSSLSRLAALPASVLKVDRSFVRGLPADHDSVVLTSTIVKLAQGIGMLALAEGIETEAQRRFLADLGCTLGQGFLFSRPVPAAEIEAMLAAGRRAA